MLKRLTMAGVLTLALGAGAVSAEPAKVMIPANPGGGWDGAGRHTMAAFAQSKVFTDGASFTNKGGAAGTIGLAEFVRTAKGDDNALLVTGVIMVGGVITNKTPVSLADTTPLLRLTNEYNAIAVPANSPIKTPQDFVAALKADPGALSVGGGSAGGADHVMLALLAKHAGAPVAKINFVSFSGGEILAALGGGKIKAAISGASEFRQFAEFGTHSDHRGLRPDPRRRHQRPDAEGSRHPGRDRQLARLRRRARHERRRQEDLARSLRQAARNPGLEGDPEEPGLGGRLSARRRLQRLPEGRERELDERAQGSRHPEIAASAAGTWPRATCRI
ncbi:hypothetical protein BTHI11S_00204 [Bosea thiooxidans]